MTVRSPERSIPHGGLVEHWISPRGWRCAAAAAIIVAMIGAGATLVYEMGGTRFSWTHFTYIPVILAGVVFGPRGGFVAGAIAGLALGPFMPSWGPTGEMQPLTSWLIRLGFFAGIGTFVGVLFSAVMRHLELVRQQALHDPSTGVRNRAYLEGELDRAVQQRKVTTLACIDLDCRAEIVSSQGSPALDRVVKEVAARIDAILPPGAEIARFFDDKIAILFSRMELAEARRHVGMVRRALADPLELGGVPVHVGEAVGIAEYPTHARDAVTLFHCASKAMDRAQETGRSLVVYNESLGDEQLQALEILGALRRSIESGDLTLFYQPKLDLGTGRVCGAEALMRWSHPTIGAIRPDRFIPLLEKTALIHRATDWVCAEAIAQVAAWRQEVGIEVPVAVNLSAKNLLLGDLPDRLARCLDAHGVDAAGIEVEVTETAFMVSPEEAIATLARVSDLGIKVWLDDFGTGYASLNYLRIPPVTGIKIDRVFVGDILSDPKDQDLVSATIDVGHRLGLVVLAEGVETQPVAEWLRQAGCDQAQGYLFGRPGPAEGMGKLFAGPDPASAARD